MADKFGKQSIPLNAYEENKILNESLRKQFLAYLRKEGPYNYSKMAKEVSNRTDSNIEAMYPLPAKEVRGILESVFGLEFNFQDTIDSFLIKCKTVAGYTLIKPEKKN